MKIHSLVKVVALLVMSCAALPVRADEPAAGENIVVNGDFETGIESWHAITFDFALPDDQRKIVQRPEFLSWEQKDTADKSKGALKVAITGMDAMQGISLNNGVYCSLSRTLPAGSEIKISFKARSPIDGTLLQIERLHGGKNATSFKLTPEWKTFEATWTVDIEAANFIFTVPDNEDARPIRAVVNGVFLLDDVKIVETPKK